MDSGVLRRRAERVGSGEAEVVTHAHWVKWLPRARAGGNERYRGGTTTPSSLRAPRACAARHRPPFVLPPAANFGKARKQRGLGEELLPRAEPPRRAARRKRRLRDPRPLVVAGLGAVSIPPALGRTARPVRPPLSTLPLPRGSRI